MVVVVVAGLVDQGVTVVVMAVVAVGAAMEAVMGVGAVVVAMAGASVEGATEEEAPEVAATAGGPPTHTGVGCQQMSPPMCQEECPLALACHSPALVKCHRARRIVPRYQMGTSVCRL